AEWKSRLFLRPRELGQQPRQVGGTGDGVARLRWCDRLAVDGAADRDPFGPASALALRQNVDDVRPGRNLRSPDLDRAHLRLHLRVQAGLVPDLQLLRLLQLCG